MLIASSHSPTGSFKIVRHEQWVAEQLKALDKMLDQRDAYIRILEDQVNTDPLTGALNRRGFDQIAEQEVQRIRDGKSLGAALILIDLDYFKQINDRHGHLTGDDALIKTVKALVEIIGERGVVCRDGGDEFNILLPEVDEKTAIQIQTIVDGIFGKLHIKKNIPMSEGQKAACWIPIRASSGLKMLDGTQSYKDAKSQADQAMYDRKKEKKAGEARVTKVSPTSSASG